MKTSLNQAVLTVAITLFTATLSAPALAETNLVSSTEDGAPLVSSAASSLFENYGISADGQFVLLGDPLTCTVYRKNSVSGELQTVLENSSDGYSWCNGAALSDDGNLVAAAPIQNINFNCEEQRTDENGTTGCYLGTVTDLIIKNIATGETQAVQRELISQSGDISRIPNPTGDLPYAATLVNFAGDGGHAVTASLAVVGSATASLFRLIDVAAGTSVPLNPPLANDSQTAIISSVSISDDGNRLALLASISTPADPPADTNCSAYPFPQDNPGVPTNDDQGSYWGFGFNPLCLPSITGPDVFIWDRAQAIVTNLTADDNDTMLPLAHAPVIAGEGNHAAWINVPSFCTQTDTDSGLRTLAKCDGAGNVCIEDGCEPQLILANLSGGTRQQISAPDPETNICSAQNQNFGLDANLDGILEYSNYAECGLELSDDGQRLLFARTVSHPFGGDWTTDQPVPTPYLPNYTCIERASLATNEPVFVDCPDNSLNLPGGPVICTLSLDPLCQPLYPAPCSPSLDPLCQGQFPTPCTLSTDPTCLGQYPTPCTLSVDSTCLEPLPTACTLSTDPECLEPEPIRCTRSYPPTCFNSDGTLITASSSAVAIDPVLADYWSYPHPALVDASFRAPLTWFLYDAASQHTTLVSLADDGQLIHANSSRLAGGGTVWSFESRDPRLQDMNADEAALAEECFWSPPGVSSDLRVSTNDNTTLGLGTETIVVYPELPAFCPIPDPALARHVYAADIAKGVDLAVMTFRRYRGQEGEMQTWLGNFSLADATHVGVTLSVSGLGADGAVQLNDASDCTVYPAADATVDDTIMVRCEYATIESYKLQKLVWSISGNSRFAQVHTSIEGNEAELRQRNNADHDYVMLRRPTWRNWFSRYQGAR